MVQELNHCESGAQGWNADREKAYAALLKGLLAHARRAFPGREADALDLLQESMERLLRHFPGVLPPEPQCKAWLFQTFDRLVISHWRKQMVRQRALLDPTVHPGVMSDLGAANHDREPTAVELAMDHLTDEMLRRAVNALSPKLREAFELHLAGWSHSRIALQLRINNNAVGKRLFDARQRLRAMMEPRQARLRGAHYSVRSKPRRGGPAPAAALAGGI